MADQGLRTLVWRYAIMARLRPLMLKALHACAGLFASLALTGCFASETELIGYWAADRPVSPGIYAHTPTHPDGAEWDRPTWQGEIRLTRGRHVSDVENFPHQDARFEQLYGETYIVQIPRDDGVGYGVAFVYQDGAVISYHQPACADVDDAVLARAGVSRDVEGYCPITSLDQLKAMMSAYLDAMGADLRIDGIYRRVS